MRISRSREILLNFIFMPEKKRIFCMTFFWGVVFSSPVIALPQSDYLETIKITDSIYVFKPKIDWTHSNGIAIIGNDGVFFIDTYLQTNYAEDAIRKLKKITGLPVRFVLNTHWHNDHVMGNYVFKKAFPGCHFVAHDSTVTKMAERIAPSAYRYYERFLAMADKRSGSL
jgi:glyoxylase-like metal-dependent hydrolase (beta-lactamase superfamily II)